MATTISPTLQNLITDIRGMLNQPDPLNSFWKDEELSSYINEGIRLHFQEVVHINEGYFTTVTSLDIVANTETIALPTDFFECRALYKSVADGFLILPYRNNLTEGYSTQGGTSGDAYQPYYYFRANNIVLRPVPNFSQTSGLKLEYIQFPDTMVNGGDSMTNQISPIFKNMIVMYAVYKAKLKESLVNGVITYKPAEENFGLLFKEFKDVIANRSKNPTYVQCFNPEMGGS